MATRQPSRAGRSAHHHLRIAALTPPRFCSAWTTPSPHDLVGPGVVVQARAPGTADDAITSVDDGTDCPGGFHFGTIDLGQTGYFNGDMSFGGFALFQCDMLISVSGCSRIHWDGSATLTITFGLPSNGNARTQSNAGIATYVPDAALGQTGSITSAAVKQFTESPGCAPIDGRRSPIVH